MKRLVPVFALLLMGVVACPGCAVPKEVYMVGFFEGGQYIDLEAQKLKPPLNEPITLDRKTLYKVKTKWGDTKYSALVGPESPGAQAKIMIQTSDPTVYVDQGWVHMAGWWPLALTARVTGTPDGTRAILQVEGDGGPEKAHRVYLRELEESHHLAVKLLPTGPTHHLDHDGTHVTSPKAGALDPPQATTGALEEFAQEVERLYGVTGANP